MSNKEFLINNPLQLSIANSNVSAFRELLRIANKSIVISYSEDNHGERTDFSISIMTTSYAYGYFYLGILWAKALMENKITIE